MEKLFDLPAHPLIVHAPIVLTPIIVVLCVVVLFVPALLPRWGWPAVGAAALSVALLFGATNSGEAFEESLKSGAVERHQDFGEMTWRLSIVFLAVVLAGVITARRVERTRAMVTGRIAGAAGVLVGAAVIVYLVRTGHSGAEAVWDGVLPE